MLIHIPSRSLLIDADPAAISAAVPATPVSGPGFRVAAKHTEAATVELRRLGYPAPSPIVSYYKWPKYQGKFSPFDHQKLLAEFMTLHKRCFNLAEMGCVDGSTEYLSSTGWRRIDSYTGGPVGQYDPEGKTMTFAEPVAYIAKPCNQMIRFQTSRGVDQLLSAEHRVLLDDGRVVSPLDVLEAWGSQSKEARSHRFRTVYTPDGLPRLDLSDDLIRLQVAVNADGHYPANSAPNRVAVRLKRPRKIARMRALLAAARVTHVDAPCEPEGFRVFRFTAPLHKGFGPEWWSCDARQLALVAEEIVHWDGSVGTGRRGPSFTGTKADVDFAQHAFAATGRRATMRQDTRSPDVWELRVDGGTDATVGLVQRDSRREPNVRVEPAPGGMKYCFTMPTGFLVLRRNGCIFATGNSGKTNSVLWALDYLMSEGQVRKAVITAPLSTLERVWLQGVLDTIMHRRAVIVHGSREKRLALLKGKFDIFIINHEGLTIKPVREAVRAIPDLDLIVVDEGSKFRNAKTDKYHALESLLSKPKMRLWWLTGTPTPSGPDDAWAQARLVNPTAVPRFFGQFRNRVMVEMAEHVWKPRAGHQDVVHTAMQPAIRIAKADCLDLPPMTTVDWACEMTPDQAKAYKQMAEAMQVADHAAHKQGVVITAANAADRVNKLRQIMLGSVKTGPDDYQTYDYTPRYKLLREAIESASAKAVVIAPFKGIIQDLEKRLAQDYSVGMVNGDVSIGRRNKIFADFKMEKDPRVLLCHPEVMSHGLNLTEADFLILFGPIYSNDVYRQVVERINRPPQTRKMTVVRIGCNALEWAIYKSLDTDEQQQQLVLNLYKSVIQGA